MSNPAWAMPSKIRIKSTGEVGRLEMIHYGYKDEDDLLYVHMDDGRTVRVMGANAEHAATQQERGTTVTEHDNFHLISQLAAATARAEAAEAALAAVPRDAISSVICETAVHLDRAQLRQQLDMIRRWAAQQAVQP